MNYSDRVRVIRREETGPGTFRWETIKASQVCRVEVLNALMSLIWGPGEDGAEVATQANLRLPKTYPQWPEPGYQMTDYRFTILNPTGFPEDLVFELKGKRILSNHILYLLEEV